MRAKRFTAILLLIVTVIGLFPAVSMAAETACVKYCSQKGFL